MKQSVGSFFLAAGLTLPVSAMAADMTVKVSLPQLEVAEYHRPYVAFWLEGATGPARTLAVWYDVDKKNGEGTKWLKDMRQWWRMSGRELVMPVDGVSGATRPVGEHTLQLSDRKLPLKGLAPGQYRLRVEAAREVGGRELLEIPFVWPPVRAHQLKAQGQSELATVVLILTP